MNKTRVFVVDDERIIRVTLADELRDAGYDAREFADASAALAMLHEEPADIIITDLKMPGMDGVEFLEKVKSYNPDIAVVLMTAYATVGSAVEAMKRGAADYLIKPFQSSEMLLILDKIKEFREIKNENILLKKQLDIKYDFSNFVGSERSKNALQESVMLLLENKTTVILSGETGTGKELLANIIHYNSNRRAGPLVRVSCAILSKEIFESELFGHVKGAFTGADKDKTGRFEMAHEGTLYLDDIDDMPLDLQVKLLRVLEEGEIERVGSSEQVKVDVRIIASTKADLKERVEAGSFRKDLFYRLNVFPIHIPPLRERCEDIPYLCNYFYNRFTGIPHIPIEKEALDMLTGYPFPGNVRELRNLLERVILLARGNLITACLIPDEIRFRKKEVDRSRSEGLSLPSLLTNVEIEAMKNALMKSKGNKSKAADMLGIPLSTLRTKMEKYNLD